MVWGCISIAGKTGLTTFQGHLDAVTYRDKTPSIQNLETDTILQSDSAQPSIAKVVTDTRQNVEVENGVACRQTSHSHMSPGCGPTSGGGARLLWLYIVLSPLFHSLFCSIVFPGTSSISQMCCSYHSYMSLTNGTLFERKRNRASF